MLVVVETHPIQYHAPVWAMASSMGVPLHVVYGCNFSVSGYHDKDFNAPVKWEESILKGYSYEFLPTNPGSKPAQNYDTVTSYGLSERIAALDPSGLLCCGYTHQLDRAGLKVARKKNIKVMYRGEANDTAKNRNAAKRFARDSLLREIYSHIDCFLSIGTEAKNHYIRLGVPNDKIFRSPYAVNTTPFKASEQDRAILRAEARKELRIPEETKVVLYSGKLTHRKGVDQLLTAISLLPAEERPTLIMLGDGELRQEIESSLLPVKRIVLGFRPQDQLSRYFHCADLLVLPSRHSETWGLVVNEALEHGLPVVVSDCVGSRHDLVIRNKTGEVFERGNINDLTKALKMSIHYDQSIDARQMRRELMKDYSIEAAATGVYQAWSWLRSV